MLTPLLPAASTTGQCTSDCIELVNDSLQHIQVCVVCDVSAADAPCITKLSFATTQSVDMAMDCSSRENATSVTATSVAFVPEEAQLGWKGWRHATSWEVSGGSPIEIHCSGKEATICQAFVDAKIPPSGTSADMLAYFIGCYDKAIQFLDTKPFGR